MNREDMTIQILKDRYASCHDATERLFIEEDMYLAREEARRLAFEEYVWEVEHGYA